jgi:hypothetical protein
MEYYKSSSFSDDERRVPYTTHLILSSSNNCVALLVCITPNFTRLEAWEINHQCIVTLEVSLKTH